MIFIFVTLVLIILTTILITIEFMEDEHDKRVKFENKAKKRIKKKGKGE